MVVVLFLTTLFLEELINMVLDAFTENYDEIELFGKPALHTILKIDRDTVPPHLTLMIYDILIMAL